MKRSMNESIQLVLRTLAEKPRDDAGYSWTSGQEVQDSTGLSAADINDVVTVLEESGMVEVLRYLGTSPFLFGQVGITSRGRYEWERIASAEKERKTDVLVTETMSRISLLSPEFRPPAPVGSPFGFTDIDWEIVADARARSDELRVVLGHAFETTHFDVGQLKLNVEQMFRRALQDYSQGPGAIQGARLDFRMLGAGYGEHLFNEIARDIISADIAVFETSDLNPNVMIEMGVALTWGVRVLPIKEERCPKPPSDISGQTWADYRDSAIEFVDPRHHEKLMEMVERAVRKKMSRHRQ